MNINHVHAVHDHAAVAADVLTQLRPLRRREGAASDSSDTSTALPVTIPIRDGPAASVHVAAVAYAQR